MGTSDKLAALTERHNQVRRELDSIAAAKPESKNAALADLEKALLAELDRIDEQIENVRTYLGHCTPATSQS